ncbi:hypothetical protein BD309DRAFT_994555 [Dichomitus squalens]|uniref:Uncharacterized protein n=1 Tax=Dichomitus squalens TaxID=114155 RepID=A0A4Q9PDW1_9APHY|nr:hypothetical protein BD309DRAFT_994555 [Dichomitus squalens]TBU51427.1 hypothetical protein BD310DRAFT_953278 [Dichomitus squalens]
MPHIDPISVVSKLDVLLKEDPDPSIEMAEIWAESLGDDVFPEHILTYAFLRRASSRQGSIDEKWVAGPSADIHTPSLALAAPDILASGSSSGPSDYQSVQGSPSSPCQSPLPSLPLHHPSGDSTGHLTPAMNPSSLLLIPKVEEATLEGASNEAGSLSQTVRLSGPVRPSGRAASHATSPPQQLVILPEELAQGLRAAPLDSVSRDDSEIPKTFADFTRWLQQLNASAGIGTLS